MIYHWYRKPQAILFTPLLLVLLFAVACGSAAAPEADTATSAPAPTSAAAAAQPTAVPQSTEAPEVMAEVEPTSTATVMISEFRAEQFYPRYNALMAYSRLLHGYVIACTDKGAPAPAVAESWRLNQDGTEWTVRMREGIKYHNGEEATAEDLVFSLHRPFDLSEFPEPSNATNMTEGRRRSKPPEITAPNEVTVFYKSPNAYFLNFFGQCSGSSTRSGLLSPSFLGEPYDQTEPAYEENPIGAGAFSFVDHVESQSITFERFADYYYHPDNGLPEDRRAQVQTLILRAVPELATRVAALRAGEADLVEASLAVRDQIENAGGRIIFAPEASYITLAIKGCWVPETRCSDKRVRHALDYAIDDVLIKDTLYSDEVAVVTGNGHGVTPSSLGYSPELAPFPYDPDKARELMQAAGYKVPGSSEGKDFGKLIINTWDAGDTPFVPDMANLIAEFWRTELGIDAEVLVSDRNIINARNRAQELHDQVRLGTNEPKYDTGSRLQSGYIDIESKYRRFERQADPEFQDMLIDVQKVVDPALRQEAMNRAWLAVQEWHSDWSPMYINSVWGAGERVEEYRPWSLANLFNAAYTIRLKE